MSTVEDRLANIENAVATLIDKVSGLEEKMLWGFEAIQKPTETTQASPAQVTPPAGDDTILTKLMEAGLNASMIEIDPVTGDISPVKFLADQWGGYNTVLQGFGFKWVKAGKESRWSRKSTGVSEAPEAIQTPLTASADSVEGVVKYDPSTREVNTMRGPTKVTDITLSTSTGDVRVSVWEAMVPPQIAKGKTVKVSGVKKGQPYKGVDQWTGNSKTTYIVH